MLPLLRSDWDDIQDWLDDHGSDILIILAFVCVAYVLFRALFPRIARAAMMRSAHPPDEEMEKRADTIIAVVDRTARVGLVLVAIVTVLPEFGVNITAIVTGLGISGLALALGSQQLVRVGLNGMFLLAEDQYRTGDVVTMTARTRQPAGEQQASFATGSRKRSSRRECASLTSRRRKRRPARLPHRPPTDRCRIRSSACA